MSGYYFDHDGNPLTLMEWARRCEDAEYRRLVQTFFEDEFVVSTVWLGLNHNYLQGPPLIFETMVFGPANVPSEIFPDRMFREEYDMQRYATKDQALEGHWQMVAMVSVEHGEPVGSETAAWA